MSIAVIGEALVDFIVQDDGSYVPHLGGSPYNLAIGLARQDVPVTYLSPLSGDVFGEQLRNELLEEGVILPFERRSPKPTSLAMVTVDALGIPAYGFYRDGVADKDCTVDELRVLLPSNLQVLHTGSLAITPSQVPKILEIFHYAKGKGVLTSIDINIRLGASSPTEAYLDGVRAVFAKSDIVKASDEDLLALGIKAAFEDEAPKFNELGNCQILVITYGAKGSSVTMAGDHIKVPAAKVGAMADTVGAGDSFYAGFLAELYKADCLAKSLEQIPVSAFESALKLAALSAAINITRPGCNPPSSSEISKFYA